MRRGDAAPWAWAFWLVLLTALLVFGAYRVWFVHESARQQLETIEPRYARLLGLGAAKTQLEAVAARTAQDLARHVYPASRDVSQAGNDAQQRVRDVFSKAGLEVISIQLLPAKNSPQFEQIPVALRVEGEMTSLQAGLAALPSMTPSLFVEGFNMQSVSGAKPGAPIRIVAQLDLFVLRNRR